MTTNPYRPDPSRRNPYRTPEGIVPARPTTPRPVGVFVEDQPGRWAFWVEGRIVEYDLPTAEMHDAVRRARLSPSQCVMRDGGRDTPL